MEKEEIAKVMREAATDAVTIASDQFSVDLDFSPDSLTKLDFVLLQYNLEHEENPLSSEHLFTISNIFGGYVGETFIRNVGGEWFQDESDPDAPFLCVKYSGKSFPFASTIYQKVIDDPQVSIAKYYDLATQGVVQ
ncbi:hypothetical protein [Algicola sagamiensis]|uniref:hypothetical protein n=1 Tax=Algicola sagamiensis TaxID=163869 RepID=UPI0003667B24|nr:hypothetical protein [Algicola sagamiensis]